MWFCCLKTVGGVLLAILALFGLSGCATLNAQPPVEHFANKLADEAIIPAVREGLSQGVEQLVIQAGAQGINPTYVVKFSGKWVTGVEGAASVGVEGIAGQLQVTSASSEETESSPHRREKAELPTTQPAVTERSPASGPGATVPATIPVTITDVDRDEDKGFARLPDGTLVVVPGAADRLGQTIAAEITARAGRLITARLVEGR